MKIQARKALLPTLAVCGAAALIGIASSGSAVATTATTTMAVSLTIAAGCATTATALNFGTANVLAAPIDQTSDITVTCTDTTPYNLELDSGAHAVTGQRNMTGPGAGTAVVAYNLYQNAGRTQAWGVTVSTDTVAATGTGASQPYTVYGRVVGPQTSPAPGGYADVVNVNVVF